MGATKLYKYLDFQLSNKSKGLGTWTRGQAVYFRPLPTYMNLLPGQDDDKGSIDWKEIRAFPEIGGECFESVYLGINMDTDEKSKIISVAWKLNSDIKIYQMGIDANAFKLNTELIK